jgi:hypothetical protein
MHWSKRPKKQAIHLILAISFLFCIRCEQMNHDVAALNVREKVTKMLGPDETCVKCHTKTTGLADSHNPSVIGCASCHLGDPLEEDKDLSHAGMVGIPGNLNSIHLTCGRNACHQDISDRLKGSLMTTMAGVINIDRFVFGESDTLTKFAHVKNLKDDTPADTHLRQLCASCHLGNEKTSLGPVSENSRGGGCLACHLKYHDDVAEVDTLIEMHPSLTINVQNRHCFGCHSRSGRISTNYEGWHETTIDSDSFTMKEGYRLLEDGRIFTFISADVHHEAGMECIDCHTAPELMGDGRLYLHKEEAVKIKCEDCHSREPKSMVPFAKLDLESQKILGLRKTDLADKTFLLGNSGIPYINVSQKGSEPIKLTTKNKSIPLSLTSPAEICTKGSAHDHLSCNTCHSGWAPQCVGCHTEYNPQEPGFDHITKKSNHGKWEEYIGEFYADLPPLGISEKKTKKGTILEIKTFVNGMTMRLDQTNYPSSGKTESFHRLFAPVSAHTITRKGRNCKSCHNDPTALGYGKGVLNYYHADAGGKWSFAPEYANEPEDGLPQDAWIGFLQSSISPNSTRPNARPFSIEEQKRILTIGACLTCHGEDSKVMLESLNRFETMVKNLDSRCILPVWD